MSILLVGPKLLGGSFIRLATDLSGVIIQAEQCLFQRIILQLLVKHGLSVATIAVLFFWLGLFSFW